MTRKRHQLHLITRGDKLVERWLESAKDDAYVVDLRKKNVDYHELLQLIFESDHVHVW